MMFSMISSWWQARIVRRSTIPKRQWHDAIARLPLLRNLSEDETEELIRLSILFLHYKVFEGAKSLEINLDMKLTIALQACLPILRLGIDWYHGWVSVIVYPAQFVPERIYVDEFGVEHNSRTVLSGESWHRGPVVLSWEDTQHAGHLDGDNLVIHEFAHKLDVLNGKTNGFPPLPRGMSSAKWAEALTSAYEDLEHRYSSGQNIAIDAYAISSPAEFFAVFSEVFFERPHIVNEYYPAVYQQFKQFYPQDPLTRLAE